MKVLGKFLMAVEFFWPDLAREWRMAVIDSIMSKYTDSWTKKLAVMNKLNKFLATMRESQRNEIVESLGIPQWSNNGNYKGMI